MSTPRNRTAAQDEGYASATKKALPVVPLPLPVISLPVFDDDDGNVRAGVTIHVLVQGVPVKGAECRFKADTTTHQANVPDLCGLLPELQGDAMRGTWLEQELNTPHPQGSRRQPFKGFILSVSKVWSAGFTAKLTNDDVGTTFVFFLRQVLWRGLASATAMRCDADANTNAYGRLCCRQLHVCTRRSFRKQRALVRSRVLQRVAEGARGWLTRVRMHPACCCPAAPT